MVLTPFLTEVPWVVVDHHGGSARDFIRDFDAATFALEFPLPSLTGLRTVLAWALFQAVLLWTLPGARFPGPVTPKGNQPVYRNGGLAWAVLNVGVLLLCALLYWKGRRWPSTTEARYTGRLPFDFVQLRRPRGITRRPRLVCRPDRRQPGGTPPRQAWRAQPPRPTPGADPLG